MISKVTTKVRIFGIHKYVSHVNKAHQSFKGMKNCLLTAMCKSRMSKQNKNTQKQAQPWSTLSMVLFYTSVKGLYATECSANKRSTINVCIYMYITV